MVEQKPVCSTSTQEMKQARKDGRNIMKQEKGEEIERVQQATKQELAECRAHTPLGSVP